VGGVQVHLVTGRYSELRKRFKDLFQDFPSRHPFRDYTNKQKNVERRAEELRQCFERNLNMQDEGRLLASERTLLALGVTSAEATQALAAVAEARRAAAEAARHAEAARLAAIDQQQREDCRHAQDFNTLAAYVNIPPGSFAALSFPHQLSFELRNKWWGWAEATIGNADIKGPGGHPWFKMDRTNPSIFGEAFKNCQFVISNMQGQPLLLLQEKFHMRSYEYELLRIDPRMGPIPMCKILRDWSHNLFHITDQYELQLHAPMAALGRIQCQGSWPSQFTLSCNGAPMATVSKEFFAVRDKYQVSLAPNCDVLLCIGVACAIDRIHHEVEDRKRE